LLKLFLKSSKTCLYFFKPQDFKNYKKKSKKRPKPPKSPISKKILPKNAKTPKNAKAFKNSQYLQQAILPPFWNVFSFSIAETCPTAKAFNTWTGVKNKSNLISF